MHHLLDIVRDLELLSANGIRPFFYHTVFKKYVDPKSCRQNLLFLSVRPAIFEQVVCSLCDAS